MDGESRPAPGDIPALTGVRAYAAVWVMLLHLTTGPGIRDHFSPGAVIGHGFWAVDVFFVLSGFLLSMLYARWFETSFDGRLYHNYLAARFSRIYPLHLFTLSLLIPLALVSLVTSPGIQSANAFGLKALLLNVTLLHGWGFSQQLTWNFPSWSISTEWFAYLFLLPLLGRALRDAGLVTVLLVAACGWAALYAAVHGAGEIIGHQALPRIAAEFTLGYAAFRIHRSVRLTRRQSDGLLVFGLGGIVALCFAPRSAEWALAPAVLALILALAAPGPAGRALFANRAAIYWGERSYSIYMLHAVVQLYFGPLIRWADLAHPAPGQAGLMLLAQIAVVLAASSWAYRWIEMPVRNRLRSALESGKPPVMP